MDPQQIEVPQNEKQNANSKGSFKVKLAFFFGYNGQKFQGMQYQREHANTIQNILHALMVENGFILKSNAQELKRIRWSRAARTDKKVHALCNGISMMVEISEKFVLEPGTREVNYNKVMCELNSHLPMDIRILVMRKTGKGFDMRHDAKTRIYNYIIPSRLFQPFAKFQQGQFVEGERLQKLVQNLNNIVKFYLGTHNFWNFTKAHKVTDPKCVRFMIKMSVQKVEESTVKSILKQCGKDQQKQYESFIRFTLVGQSFIYHQIRKMIGLLIKILSQQLDPEATIKRAFKLQQYDGYLAPGEGLYLNRMTFQSYNNRKDTKQKLQFTEQQEERINKYRAYLESKIIKHQIEEGVFTNWLGHRIDYDKKQENQEPESEESQEENDQGKKKKNKHKNNQENKNNGNEQKNKQVQGEGNQKKLSPQKEQN